MTAILVVAAPRKVLRQRTCKIAPESRYTADWYGAIGSPQTRQTLTSTGAPLWSSALTRPYEDVRDNRSTSSP